jgi:hypothetical protein
MELCHLLDLAKHVQHLVSRVLYVYKSYSVVVSL